VTRDKNKGTATLAVAVPGAGELALGGQGLKAASATAGGAGEVTLSVKAAGKAKKKLRRKGKKTFSPAVTFTPTGGTANTESTSVKLVRK
jgi:large repetitive protein